MGRKNRDPKIVAQPRTELRIDAMRFSGPIPPPEVLGRYNLVVPGAAERILGMAESQHSHRLQLEDRVIKANISAQRLGTVLGFTVAMTSILGGIFLVFEGKGASGITAILTALVALVGVFVYSKREQQKELARKSDSLRPLDSR